MLRTITASLALTHSPSLVSVYVLDLLGSSLLSLRDHAILKLSARHRRITASLLLGKTQVEIARVEKLSQQAISDFARGSGAGLIQSSLIIAEAARA